MSLLLSDYGHALSFYLLPITCFCNKDEPRSELWSCARFSWVCHLYLWDHEMYGNFMRFTKNLWGLTCLILTNSEADTLWSFISSRIEDYTLVIACIFRIDIPHLKHATFPRMTLPSSLFTLLSKLFPLPLVAQRLCSSGFDWECNCLSWKNIILACWLRHNFGRFNCKNGWKLLWHNLSELQNSGFHAWRGNAYSACHWALRGRVSELFHAVRWPRMPNQKLCVPCTAMSSCMLSWSAGGQLCVRAMHEQSMNHIFLKKKIGLDVM